MRAPVQTWCTVKHGLTGEVSLFADGDLAHARSRRSRGRAASSTDALLATSGCWTPLARRGGQDPPYDERPGEHQDYVYFYPDGTPLADPIHDATNGRVYLSFNLSQLPAVLDVLRNEKPLVVYYESATNAALRSGVEPVGEEEGTGKP